ncbi:cryptochrome/photolyase family protein [Sphingomonas corticis]|jgi:deoxyribodipyrimidine photolyase-related protein|uniref:Cryptochrome/photolyase family protein n=1 Tax=Sphingomonas corticis TaxID=2722791 RepID=A0ABX1CNL0_9SPHN|nr:cryptochrome/photolyase family protein [Sphingomonas corticis]NJR79551.1 cryptochrome/photolyase family protein [Sphingomonas corticis]
MATLVPVLGDQLSLDLASLADADPADTIVLMMEVAEETAYVRHHRTKLAYILSAMRHHADALTARGWRVDYVRLDDPQNSGSFTGEIARALARHAVERIVVTEAGEWRVAAMLDSWQTLFGVPVEIRTDTRFLATHAEFAGWADGRKQLTMEYFYRAMRARTGLLMTDGKPEGGRWNFDKENRKPAERDLLMPRPLSFAPDAITTEVIALVERRFAANPGSLDGFDYAVTAADAERQAAAFLAHALPRFGDYEDAMLTGERFLWHSILSPYINSGLLDPLDLCRRAEAEYRAGRAPLNSVEGYIRQIIGWREYMRGIYWREGPGYVDRNFLDHRRALPAFYWTGETDMHCLSEVLSQTLATAHAHHIQRLMVTGNFALLIGADPKQVHLWYLEIYLDAYEWVELPNTLGMSQFGDGGLLGSKPYVSSGAYINRMSDYCRHCRYDVNRRTGEDACPFNALYWHFLDRHRAKLGDNRRLAMPYRTWDRQSDEERAATRAQADAFLAALDDGGAYADPR